MAHNRACSHRVVYFGRNRGGIPGVGGVIKGGRAAPRSGRFRRFRGIRRVDRFHLKNGVVRSCPISSRWNTSRI